MHNTKILYIESIRDNTGEEIKLENIENIALYYSKDMHFRGVAIYKEQSLVKSLLKYLKDCYFIATGCDCYKYIVMCNNITIEGKDVRFDVDAVIETIANSIDIYNYILTNNCKYTLTVIAGINYSLNNVKDKTIRINNINIDINTIEGEISLTAHLENIYTLVHNIKLYRNILYYYFDIDADCMYIEYSEYPNSDYTHDTIHLDKLSATQMIYDAYHVPFVYRLIREGVMDIQNNYLVDAAILKLLHNNTGIKPHMTFNINKLIHMVKKVVKKDVIHKVQNDLKIVGKHDLLIYTTLTINNEEYKFPCVKEICKLNHYDELTTINYLLEANYIMLDELKQNNLDEICNTLSFIYASIYRNRLTHEDDNAMFVDNTYIMLYNNLMILYNYYIHSGSTIERATIAKNFSIEDYGNSFVLSTYTGVYNGEIVLSKKHGITLSKHKDKYYANIKYGKYNSIEVINKTNISSLPENKPLKMIGNIRLTQINKYRYKLSFILIDFSE